jgi:hypothetical protein
LYYKNYHLTMMWASSHDDVASSQKRGIMMGESGRDRGKRNRNRYISECLLTQAVMELDDIRSGLNAAMSRPASDPQWAALALAMMAKAHNTIVWLLHEDPMKELHARNWRERHALEQGSGSGEEAA